MKLLFIVGTRPDAIKLAPVIKKAKEKKNIKTYVCLTAQHRQMLDQVIDFFGIKPDFDLNIMTPNQDLFKVTARLLERLGKVIKKVKPDWVIVQGDTTTTFAGALSAFYLKTKIAHVEAGLRTFNKYSPFPEEINRSLTTRLADLHFAPTKKAKEFLLKEGIPSKKIVITGNTGVDALFLALKETNNIERRLPKIDFSKKIVLVTGHRRESFGRPLKEICLALKNIAKSFPEIEIIYPVHLNPNVKKPVFAILKNIKNIHLIKPLDYPSFTWIMKQSFIILTDSGGIQEEAPSFKKPVLVMRSVTERPEGIEAGIAKLVGTSKKEIIRAIKIIIQNKHEYKKMQASKNPYGDGKASGRIIKALTNA
ncbi:MAG: UDP-N-acetylglucosamine 2-epimerase (non-hydrolyzing) [bacterium]